jgi:hypothetical protein
MFIALRVARAVSQGKRAYLENPDIIIFFSFLLLFTLLSIDFTSYLFRKINEQILGNGF